MVNTSEFLLGICSWPKVHLIKNHKLEIATTWILPNNTIFLECRLQELFTNLKESGAYSFNVKHNFENIIRIISHNKTIQNNTKKKSSSLNFRHYHSTAEFQHIFCYRIVVPNYNQKPTDNLLSLVIFQ